MLPLGCNYWSWYGFGLTGWTVLKVFSFVDHVIKMLQYLSTISNGYIVLDCILFLSNLLVLANKTCNKNKWWKTQETPYNTSSKKLNLSLSLGQLLPSSDCKSSPVPIKVVHQDPKTHHMFQVTCHRHCLQYTTLKPLGNRKAVYCEWRPHCFATVNSTYIVAATQIRSISL